VLVELGAPTVALGVAGGGAGYILKSLLRERGVPFEPVEILEETRINFILTDRSDRSQTRISAPGPWVSLEEAEKVVARSLDREPLPRWWVLGGSLPRGIPGDFYARMDARLRDRGARSFVDADDDTLKIAVEASPFAIKPNDNELSRLVGRELHTDDEILDAAREVVAAGVEIVAVTLGERGALVVTERRAVRAFAPKVAAMSKVGAGDSFLAGFAWALSRGDSIEEATRLATAAGTAAVMHEGTQLCRRWDVMKLMPQIELRSSELERRRKSASAASPPRDLVCGTAFDPSLASFSARYDGRDYRFCSLACQHKFLDGPERYVNR